MVGYGYKPGDGLMLVMAATSTEYWIIRPEDTNVYFMSGTFTATTPTNYIAKSFEDSRSIWTGKLELPKMKISVPKR
jgi:hypothetical protein